MPLFDIYLLTFVDYSIRNWEPIELIIKLLNVFGQTLVSYSELLKINIPGTGLVLLLNPDLENPNVDFSIIPIVITWDWGIQQFIKNFKLSSFSFKAEAFYDPR